MIRKLLYKLMRWAWCLPAALMWAAFPPMGEATDVLFALAPLMWLARNADPVRNVRIWFANGFLFFFASLAWMPAIVKNGGPWPLVALGWGLLSAYCAIYFAAFGFLSSRYWRWAGERGGYRWRLVGILFVEPVLWAGLEILRSRLFGGFAWNQLGVAAVNCGFGALASIGGVYLLSACIILINGTIASIAERMTGPFLAGRSRRMQVNGHAYFVASSGPAYGVPSWLRSIETVIPFAMIWVAWQLSTVAVARSDADEGSRMLKVAMIQRNFPCCFKAPEAEDPIGAYSNLLANVIHLKPDLVVLSESAMSEFGRIDGANARRVARWIERMTGAAVIAGGGRRDANGLEYNSAALYHGERVEVYDKVHLVPFGEFIPLDKLIPALQKLAPVGSCTPGSLKTLAFGETPIGIAICYEDTDSAQIRELAKMGAKVLVFVTNDSWFSNSPEALQHAWQARARAIETGLAVVRVGNSGVTGTVSPNGNASWMIDENGVPLVDKRGSMFDRVALGSSRTPYVRYGDAPLFFLFLLLISGMILVKYIYYAKRRALSLQVR